MNIFENAKFGDAFKTRDGRKAIFLGLRYEGRKALMLYNISTTDFYIGDKKDVDICTGMLYASLETTSDIIGKWNEPVSEEELREMSYKADYTLNSYTDKCESFHEGFHAGYRKAEERLL